MVNLEKKVVGVDVSSKFLTMSFKNEHNQEIVINIGNLKKDIVGYLKKLKKEDYKVVVEATGSYSSKILYYSYSMGFDVCRVSPLTIKKYAEVKNQISKTDDEDAKLIRDFGEKMELSLYEPKNENLEFLEQELTLWQDLEQEKVRFSLKLKSLRQKARLNKEVLKHYETLIDSLQKEIEKLQKRLPRLEDGELKENKDLLKSINGIGEKTSLLLLVATNHFKDFKHSKSVSKYFGVAPRMYHSGNKKVTIGKCRTSKEHIRSILFICSWSAVKCNPQCKALYERILEKGKCKKLALIAVCNKLLRQAFGIIKSKNQYQLDFVK
jgi:transposase